jgi:hypothetical protein
VHAGNKSAHEGDWNGVKKGTAWLKEQGSLQEPFFAYQVCLSQKPFPRVDFMLG